MIWFTSDTHYWHSNVIDFCERPFDSLDHMHEELIKRYNSRVRPEDTCIFVGDFSFGNSEQTKNIYDRLNGKKILVQGNHDKKSTLNKFHLCVCELKMFISGKPVSVKHYPLKWAKWSHLKERLEGWWDNKPAPRYMERRSEDRGQLHIHGHTHSTRRYSENQIHVGVDAWDYYPVSLKELSRYIQSQDEKR